MYIVLFQIAMMNEINSVIRDNTAILKITDHGFKSLCLSMQIIKLNGLLMDPTKCLAKASSQF